MLKSCISRVVLAMSLNLLIGQVHASQNIGVFVSLSMPKTLLIQTLRESAHLHIPAFLNGLHHNSMPQTARLVMDLSKEVPNLNLQIDPTAFERFGIHQVPALVVDDGKKFDVIYGNLTLIEGLSRMAGNGDSGLTQDDVRGMSGE